MKKLLATIALLFVAITLQAQEKPNVFLENVAGNMINQIESNKTALKNDSKLADKLVRDTLLPAIDSQAFARKTLSSKTWKTLSEEQQTRFTTEFINLVVGNYAAGIALYDGQTFKFSEPHFSKSGNGAKVRSSMEQNGAPPILIDYVLSKKSGSWKIIDLTIEGVNMSKSYKSQFLPRIKTMGMNAFLVEMESKSSEKANKEAFKKS
jgi:phospholipid transport system substrate-binding protein